MKVRIIRTLLYLSLGGALVAQATLTNETILKLVKAGIGEEVIVGMIDAQPGKYSLGVDDVLSLKTAGVSDKLLAAMLRKNEKSEDREVLRPPSAPAGSKIGGEMPDELGVYHLKDGKYIALKPEILNLRTARAASLFTSGVVAAKVNGWVVGQHSPNRMGPAGDIVAKLPEGTDASEYVLFKFTIKGDRREVELARGRINVSVSTHRAALPFTSDKLDKGLYRFRFGTLAGGEYGL
jgi:hypothetical protein